MELLIVISLLIVIVLLLRHKIVIHKGSEEKPVQEKVKPNLPDIMGQPKPVKNQFEPNTANECQITETEISPDNLDIEYDENVSIQIPQEEAVEVFGNMPNLEEEEEWGSYVMSDGDHSLAQGVTFDELSSVRALLQKENLEHTQNETSVAIVHKLQGTELFSLLENSIDGASRKIAMLLDSALSSENEVGCSTLRNNDLNNFDIGEFV